MRAVEVASRCEKINNGGRAEHVCADCPVLRLRWDRASAGFGSWA